MYLQIRTYSEAYHDQNQAGCTKSSNQPSTVPILQHSHISFLEVSGTIITQYVSILSCKVKLEDTIWSHCPVVEGKFSSDLFQLQKGGFCKTMDFLVSPCPNNHIMIHEMQIHTVRFGNWVLGRLKKMQTSLSK